MYRCGWAIKPRQETVLAIRLKKDAFINYLKEAEYSSFGASAHANYDTWKNKLSNTNCRLQWDPDHAPNGEKEARRALQIGIKGTLIDAYANRDIIEIEDISSFVKEQYKHVLNNDLEKLLTPKETILKFEDETLNEKLQLA